MISGLEFVSYPWQARVSCKLVAAKAGGSCNEARIPSHSCYFVHSHETLPPNFPDWGASIFSILRNAQHVFPDQQHSSVNWVHQCSIQIPWTELRWNGTLKIFCFSVLRWLFSQSAWCHPKLNITPNALQRKESQLTDPLNHLNWCEYTNLRSPRMV